MGLLLALRKLFSPKLSADPRNRSVGPTVPKPDPIALELSRKVTEIKANPPKIMRTGRAQLDNLYRARIPFLLLDFRVDPNARPQFPRAVHATAETVVQTIVDQKILKDHPLVLICETGEVSLKAAQILEADGFINLFVVDGGID